MKKNEIIRRIAEDLLNENMLNEENYFDVESLLNDVCKSISANLTDYTLILTSFIIEDGE